MKLGAVILAGGKSSRMGCDKAWLEVDGQPLLARQIQLARDLGAVEIFISGRANRDYSEFGCPVLHDRFPEAGPLAGIERALAAVASPLLLVLAVDLPEINVELLRGLGAGCTDNFGAIPRVAGNIEPLAAFYPKTAQPLAEALLVRGRHAVATLAEHCVQSGLARFAELPGAEARYFANWNSPGDLASAALNG